MTTRRVIIGVLIMLMIIPLLTYNETDYGLIYGLRKLFWFGISSCQNTDSYFCTQSAPLITIGGWYHLLQQFEQSSKQDDQSNLSKELVWLYVPDFTN